MALKSFAQRFFNNFIPFNGEADAENDYALSDFCGAVGELYQDVEDLVRDTPNGDPGWSIIVDVGRIPVYALKWLAQWVGVTLDETLTEEQQRQQIKNHGQWLRGSKNKMVEAVQNTLTGDKTVILNERDSSAYHFSLFTRTSETPDPAATERALLSQKAGSLMYTYGTVADWSWLNISTNYADWQAVSNAFLNWQNVKDDVPI